MSSKPGSGVGLEQALSRWDTEGGAGPRGPQDRSMASEAAPLRDTIESDRPLKRTGRLRDRQAAEGTPPSKGGRE